MTTPKRTYESQAARDAAASGYGGESYWLYLDQAAEASRNYYLRHGDEAMAERVMARSLSEALHGNEGD